MILYVYKIRKRNEKISINTKPGYLLHPKWAFYPQLCIYRFLVLRGYGEHFYVSVSLFPSCLLLTQLVVIVEKQLAPRKLFVRTHCPPRTVGEANAPLPNAVPRETTQQGNCGLQGKLARHAVRVEIGQGSVHTP